MARRAPSASCGNGARDRGEEPKPKPGAHIQGFLRSPKATARSPAVVVLPGCAGLTPDLLEAMPRTLVSWGYVALVVDSFTPRKFEPDCLKDGAAGDRIADACGALYLADLPFVDRNRIGALGIANRSLITLNLADEGMGQTVVNTRNLLFKVGVAFYPQRGYASDRTTFPLLILVGREDRWTPAKACEDLVARRAGNDAPTNLMVFPDAHHGFVERGSGPGRAVLGYHVEYNEKIAEDSLRRAQEFLARNLKD